jgi:hypothetical protein
MGTFWQLLITTLERYSELPLVKSLLLALALVLLFSSLFKGWYGAYLKIFTDASVGDLLKALRTLLEANHTSRPLRRSIYETLDYLVLRSLRFFPCHEKREFRSNSPKTIASVNSVGEFDGLNPFLFAKEISQCAGNLFTQTAVCVTIFFSAAYCVLGALVIANPVTLSDAKSFGSWALVLLLGAIPFSAIVRDGEIGRFDITHWAIRLTISFAITLLILGAHSSFPVLFCAFIANFMFLEWLVRSHTEILTIGNQDKSTCVSALSSGATALLISNNVYALIANASNSTGDHFLSGYANSGPGLIVLILVVGGTAAFSAFAVLIYATFSQTRIYTPQPYDVSQAIHVTVLRLVISIVILLAAAELVQGPLVSAIQNISRDPSALKAVVIFCLLIFFVVVGTFLLVNFVTDFVTRGVGTLINRIMVHSKGSLFSSTYILNSI